MPTSEDLVPNGLPQGSRQEVVEGMRHGGIPTATTPQQGPQPVTSTVAGNATPGPSGPPVSGLELLRGRSPEDFPFLQGADESTSPPEDAPGSVASALAVSAQSSFARAVIARLQTKG